MFIQINFGYSAQMFTGLKDWQTHNRPVYKGTVVVSFYSDYSFNYQGYHMTFKSVYGNVVPKFMIL